MAALAQANAGMCEILSVLMHPLPTARLKATPSLC